MLPEELRTELSRRDLLRTSAVSSLGVLVAGSGVGSAAAAESSPEPASQSADAPSLATTDRLEDRRYVATGSRGYVVGTQTGQFPAMGWHVEGEMGGIWSPPLKLLDGIWFAVDGDWLEAAEEFESGYGHVNMRYPDRGDLSVSRTDFVPDGRRGALVGLTFAAGDAEERFSLTVDAHSELMSAYPWEWTTPSQETFNLDDDASTRHGRLQFRERGTPPAENATEHDWVAVVGTDRDPTNAETGDGYFGPQTAAAVDSDSGNGVGGRLEYEVTVEANETETVWVAVGGAESGPADAHSELDALLDDPVGALATKIEDRLELRDRTRLELPGDERLQHAIDWSKQNLADSVQVAENLQLRITNEGQEYPEPVGDVDEVRFLGAGFPDYPWLFATDGEYTAYASVAVGQFEPIKDHLRALRDVSEIVNGDSGKVVHEVVTDGSVYFGTLDDPGNTDETSKFPSAVALVWRWTGDDEFRDEMYDFAKRNMRYVVEELDADGDDWPEGQGNVEREGMGEEKLDVAVYTIRGLYDLADMARSKGDGRTLSWAQRRADEMRREFEEAWWIPEIPQHAGSLSEPDEERVYQRHWIGVTPMEAELHRNNQPMPGLASDDNGEAALDLRETACYGGVGDDEESEQRRNEGLYHTGAPGCDEGSFSGTKDSAERSIFTLNSAVMAVGEGNYGRLGDDQQGRFVDANAALQLPDPDEQPGAMPEIAPSPEYGRSLDLPFTERAMVLQAWGAYGTVWPVVHQQLGVRPDLGRGRLEVTPQVPPESPGRSAENVRLGDGAVAVSAAAEDGTYETTVDAAVDLKQLVVGHTLPDDADVESVTLDGESVEHEVRETNRGREVLVEAEADGERTLVVEAAA
jgi:hypothetical protein